MSNPRPATGYHQRLPSFTPLLPSRTGRHTSVLKSKMSFHKYLLNRLSGRFRMEMLTEKVMHECVKKLLTSTRKRRRSNPLQVPLLLSAGFCYRCQLSSDADRVKLCTSFFLCVSLSHEYFRGISSNHVNGNVIPIIHASWGPSILCQRSWVRFDCLGSSDACPGRPTAIAAITINHCE